jgi:drug/metabolite transporter (DMT)-like permease
MAEQPFEDQTARPPLAGYALAATGAFLFASKGIIIKLAYAEGIDVTTLLALRTGLALPFYLAVGAFAIGARLRRGTPLPSRALVVRSALVGILGYWLASYLDFLGLVYISAQYERLILYTYPGFVILFGALFFRQPIRRRAMLAFGFSYLGLVIIFATKFGERGSAVAIGTALVLGSAIAFALYQLFAKNLIDAVGAALFTCIAMSAATASFFVQFALTRPMSGLNVEPYLFVLCLALAIGATVMPTFLMSAALQRISAQANATIGTLSPVMTIVLAVIVLGERITPIDIVGTAMVIGGVGWFALGDRRR